MSSRDDTSAYSQPCFSTSFCKFSILLFTLSPAALSDKTMLLWVRLRDDSSKSRRWFRRNRRFRRPSPPFQRLHEFNRCRCEIESDFGTVRQFLTNSKIVGTPSSPDFISVVSVVLSSLAAWMKYLPSVQRYAPSFVTKSVPALPVKPLKTHAFWSDRRYIRCRDRRL